MILSFSLIILGFVLLIYGANWLVDGSSSLAKQYKVSDLTIGLTIVAFGTSAPELIVNSVASFDGLSDIVLGNVIGSNNFNLFIILGITALVYPITVQYSTTRREIPISLLVIVLFLLFANDFFLSTPSRISRLEGLVLFGAFLFFLYFISKSMKLEEGPVSAYEPKSNYKIWGLIVLGLTGLLIGGKLVVDNGVAVATELGVSQKIIGLTIIAAGTSLPELVTSVIATIKRNSDIAIGNVIGSNIFNILLILSISAFIEPIAYNPNFNEDVLILLGGTKLLMLAMFTGKRRKLDRWEAAIFLGFYLVYTGHLIYIEL